MSDYPPTSPEMDAMDREESPPKHTPGPWGCRAGDREKRAMSTVFKAHDETFLLAYVICEPLNDQQREEDLANAALIAAAPDLLAACQRIDRRRAMGREIQMGDLDAIRAAIAKATA